MFSDKITYEDFDGNTQTQEVFFNISKVEALSLETSYPGGYGDYLQKVVDTNDNHRILEVFKDIVKKSYGVKSEDGKRFVKSEEEYKKFEESPVYDEFVMKLIGDENYALDFVIGVMPSTDGVTKEALIHQLKAGE